MTSVCVRSRSATGKPAGAGAPCTVKRVTTPVDSSPPTGLMSRRKSTSGWSPAKLATSGSAPRRARIEMR